MFGEQWVTLIAAFLIGTIAVARFTRLIAEDDWPPSAWLRHKWAVLTEHGPWTTLLICPFCLAPYIAAFDLAWAIIFDLQPAWWIVNGWLAVSYLAAMLVARDLPADQREHA